MKVLLKILKFICNTIMTLIILFGILFVGLFCFGVVPYVVKSGSMEPNIHTGSICFINQRAQYDDMKVGDVIAFKTNSGAFATHRIVSISDIGFETKGDANKVSDSIITTKDNYIGKNIFSIRYAGVIVKVLQTAKGKIILGTVIVALFIVGIMLGEPSKRKMKTK